MRPGRTRARVETNDVDTRLAREDDGAMSRKQRLTWTVVLWLAVVVTGFASLVVVGGGTALWLVEGQRPDGTIRSWGDALWWSLTTLTTVGYGDHVPVTTTGRLIAAGVMVAGVAVIGAVAAIVTLVVALRVAREEEMAFEAAAETLEQRLDARLARIEAQLAALEAHLTTWSTVRVDDVARSGRDDQ
jgi:voltage-gated potassium channel Kch